MKKLLYHTFLSFLFVFIGQTTYSQVRWGVKAGISVTKAKFLPDLNAASSVEWGLRGNIGLLSEIELSKKFYVRSELLYSLKGWDHIDGNVGKRIKSSVYLQYLSLPLLLSYRPLAKLSLMAGPEFSYLMKATSRHPDSNYDLTDLYKKLDVGLTLGTTYFLTSKLGLELRYTYGFNPLFSYWLTNRKDGYNRAFALSLFYWFGKSKD